MSKKLSALALLPLLACDTTGNSFEGVSPTELGAPVGKADGHDETSVALVSGYEVLELSGDAAAELYGVMDDAGGFNRTSQNGLDYIYGVYSICVSNGSAAACSIYSDRALLHDGDFLATVHGERFDSGASELFGALARAQGINPGAVNVISSGRYLCGKESNEVWCGLTPPNAGPSGSTLALSFAGLPVLGSGFVYEGWLITDDGPVTSGRFDVTEGVDTFEMEISAELAAESNLFVLTIEPELGDDPGPSSTHIVAGAFAGGTAVLDTVHGAALGSDFTAATGGFILETPSSANVANDYNQGVWFLDPAAGPGAGLELPALPEGWAYEGWVVGDDGPVSTGKFTDAADADRDGAGPAAGPDGTPPFPGQDFVNPAMDLIGGAVVVSVEPDPDDSGAPFALKPLAGDVVDAGAGGFQMLGNIAASNAITGVATID